MTIGKNDPLARAAVGAIHAGDVSALKQLLDSNPGLASARIGDDSGTCRPEGMTRTLLHVATDWPGHFPNAAATVALLVARRRGCQRSVHRPPHRDSSALGGEQRRRGGTRCPYRSRREHRGHGRRDRRRHAAGRRCGLRAWRAARRLIERGARANLWQAAGLGLMERIGQILAEGPGPRVDDITTAFWCACHGGQRAAAAFLLDRGPQINWVGFDRLTALDAAQRSGATELAAWLRARGGRSAAELV